MTKKILVLVLAMAMVFAFAACGSKDKESSSDKGSKDSGIVGEWKLTSAEAGGQTLKGDQLTAFDYSWKFEDNGKATINIMGQTAETTYTFENNTITFADDAAGLTLKKEGKKLIMEESTSGTKFYFEKK